MIVLVLGLSVLLMGAGLFCLACDRSSSLDRIGGWLAGEAQWVEGAAGAFYRKEEVTK